MADKNVEVRIKAIDDASRVFDKVSNEAEEAFSQMDETIKNLPDEETVDYDADTSEAMTKTQIFKQAIRSVPNTVRTKFIAETSRVQQQLDTLRDAFSALNIVGGNTFIGALISMLPALVPILAVVTAGVGGLASAFTAIAAGVAGFIAVASPAISDLIKMDKNVGHNTQQWREMSDSTREALTVMSDLKMQWGLLRESFRKPATKVFTESMRMASKLLKEAEPIIKSAMTAITSLMKDMNSAVNASDVQSFFDFLAKQSGPMIKTFGKVFGNVIRGVMNLMVSFGPTANKMGQWLLSMSKKFVKWSQNMESNQGFQNFLSFVKTNTPIVMTFMGQLISLIGNLLKGLAPVGKVILQLANRFLKWVNSIMSSNQWIVTVAGTIMSLAAAGVALLPTILSVINIFRNFGSVISKVWPYVQKLFLWLGTKLYLAFQNIIGVIARVLPYILRIGKFLLGITNPIGLVITIVTTLAIVIWQNWSNVKKWTIQIWNIVVSWLQSKWNALKSWAVSTFTGIMTFLSNTWASIQTTAIAMWNYVILWIRTKWLNLKMQAVSVFTSILQFLASTWSSIESKAIAVWNYLVLWIRTKWLTLKANALSIFSQLLSFLASTWSSIKSTAISVWNYLTSWVQSKWLSLKMQAVSVFTSILQFLASTWVSIKSTAISAWSSFDSFVSGIWSGLSSFASSTFNGILNTITSVWNSVASTTESIWSGITSSIKGAINDIVGSINSMLNSISNISVGVPSIPDWVPGIGGNGGGTLSFPSIPNIPKLATGGVVSKPTIAQVGDAGAGNPEIVAPENMIRKIIQDELKRVLGRMPSGSGGGNPQKQPLQLNLQLGDRDFEVFVDDITRQQERKEFEEKQF